MKVHKHPFPLFLFLVGSFVLLVAAAAVRAASEALAIELQAPATVASSPGSWSAGDDLFWLNPQPHGNDQVDVSCQTAMQCYAITPRTILRTEDGGHSWTQVYTHAEFEYEGRQGSLYEIDCADEHHCLVLGNLGVRLQIIDDEISLVIGQRDHEPENVNCVTASICYGTRDRLVPDSVQVRTVFKKSEDGGITWVIVNDEDVWGSGSDLACPAIDICYLTTLSGLYGQYSHIYYTADGGVTWTHQVNGDAQPGKYPGPFEYIDCISPLECIATVTASGQYLSGRYLTTRDAGETWEVKQEEKVEDDSFSRVFCEPSGVCYSGVETSTVVKDADDSIYFFYELFVLDSDWTEWQSTGIQVPLYFRHVVEVGLNMDCPEHCVAVSSGGFMMTGQGHDWHIVSDHPYSGHPYGDISFDSIDCPVPDHCVAVGEEATAQLTLENVSLQSSTVRTTGNTILSFERVSCPTVALCYATVLDYRYKRTIAKSTDGGESWANTVFPAHVSELNAIDCPTSEFCVAAGFFSKNPPDSPPELHDAVYVTRNGGETWEETSFGISREFTGVDCPTADICYVVATHDYIYKTTNAGLEWQAVNWDGATAQAHHLNDIACVYELHCTAVGATGDEAAFLVTRDGGASWYPVATGLAGEMWQIDCTSRNLCMALGGEIFRPVFVLSNSTGGDHWHNHHTTVSHPLHDVQCLGREACLIVGDYDTILGTALTLPQRALLPVLRLDS